MLPACTWKDSDGSYSAGKGKYRPSTSAWPPSIHPERIATAVTARTLGAKPLLLLDLHLEEEDGAPALPWSAPFLHHQCSLPAPGVEVEIEEAQPASPDEDLTLGLDSEEEVVDGLPTPSTYLPANVSPREPVLPKAGMDYQHLKVNED